MNYDYKSIEAKWQKKWDEEKAFEAKQDFSLPKYFTLVEFPYPSGQGLHVGHPRPYTALDIVSRKKRMQGYNVLFPMGWDAFGLPTENYAIKNKIHPKVVTEKNVARFKSQLKALGLSFDWSREINTTDPDYYKWTQWIFLQLFKKGLAYKKEMSVNFCTSCKVVLANEEVVNGVCERCSSEVIRKVKSQWMLKITEYADKLISGLDGLDFIERVKTQQINWIGKSKGAEVDFNTTAGDKLRVYTTRCDTLFLSMIPTVLFNCKRYLKPRPLLGYRLSTQPSSISTRIPVGILMVSPGLKLNATDEKKSYPALPFVARFGNLISSYIVWISASV